MGSEADSASALVYGTGHYSAGELNVDINDVFVHQAERNLYRLFLDLERPLLKIHPWKLHHLYEISLPDLNLKQKLGSYGSSKQQLASSWGIPMVRCSMDKLFQDICLHTEKHHPIEPIQV